MKKMFSRSPLKKKIWLGDQNHETDLNFLCKAMKNTRGYCKIE